VKEDLARTFLRSMEEEMRRDPGAKARWDELGEGRGKVATISAQDAARQCSVFGISPGSAP